VSAGAGEQGVHLRGDAALLGAARALEGVFEATPRLRRPRPDLQALAAPRPELKAIVTHAPLAGGASPCGGLTVV
jgi:amidase